MKILVISQYFYPENFIINELTQSLAKKGLEITVLTGFPNYPSGKIYNGYKRKIYKKEKLNERIEILRMPIFLRGKGTFINLVLNYLSFIFSSCVISPFLLKKKYDLIFVYAPSPIFQTYIGAFLKIIFKVKLITWVQDLWPESLIVTGYVKNKLLLKFISFFVKYTYKYSDLILVSSKGFETKIKNIYENSVVKYFPNPGIIKHNNENIKIKNKTFLLNDGFNIVFAGNLGKAQSLETILKAAERLKPIKEINIYLVGSGSKYNSISDEIKTKNLNNVILTGKIESQNMPIIYQQSSVLLLTLNKSEILGLTVPAKLQTYLAAAKPIICSADGEVAKIIIESQSGIACEAENFDKLYDAILTLYKSDKKILDKMGLDAKKYYNKNFDLEILTNNLIQVFNEI